MMLKKRFILVLGLSFMLSACGKAQNDVQDNTNSTMETESNTDVENVVNETTTTEDYVEEEIFSEIVDEDTENISPTIAESMDEMNAFIQLVKDGDSAFLDYLHFEYSDNQEALASILENDETRELWKICARDFDFIYGELGMEADEYMDKYLYRINLEDHDENDDFFTEITVTNKQWWTAGAYAYICGMDSEMDGFDEVSTQLNALYEKMYPMYSHLHAYYINDTFLFSGEDIISAVIGEEEISSEGIQVFYDIVEYGGYREAVSPEDLTPELKDEYEFYMLLAANDYIGAMEYAVEHDLFLANDNYEEYLDQFYALSTEQQQYIRDEFASYPDVEYFISYSDERKNELVVYMMRAELEAYSYNPDSDEKWLTGSFLYDYRGDNTTPVDPYIDVYYEYGF